MTSTLTHHAALVDPRRRTHGNRPSLAEVAPEHASVWNISLNGENTPWTVTPGSNRDAFWDCITGHTYELKVNEKTSGSGCNICSNHVLLSGFNDLLTRNPSIAPSFDLDGNNGLTPSTVLGGGSNIVRQWRCTYPHTWTATVKDRTSGSGCGVCANRVLWTGFNDLLTVAPHLAPEFAVDLNGGLTPRTIIGTVGSQKTQYIWRCTHRHTWPASVADRLRGRGCPVCTNQRLLPGFNDLATTHPHLALQFALDLNGGLTPATVLGGRSGILYWWRCDLGHAWEATVANRTRDRDGDCGICTNRTLLPGFNDLATTHPHLVPEFAIDLNGGLFASQVMGGQSSTPYWWRCTAGHTWKTKVSHRADGSGCGQCSKFGTSRVEQALFRVLAPHLTNPESGAFIPLIWATTRKQASVDISGTFHDLKVAVEYDGFYYHQTAHKAALDLSKTQALLAAGYLVVRVREDGLPHIPLADPSLVQFDYSYRLGTDAQLEVAVRPTVDRIVVWLEAQVPVAA